MKKITSDDNPTYRRLLSLCKANGVKKHGEYLLAGRKLVPEFLERPPGKLHAIITTESHREALENILGSRGLSVIELPMAMFKQLDAHGTHFPILWGVTPELPPVDLTTRPKGLELILALANPLNLGAALRSAEAFSVNRVVLLNECANPFLSKVLRASSGSALRLNIFMGPSIHDLQVSARTELTVAGQSESPSFWALDKRGRDISKQTFARDFRLLIGEEGLGVPDTVASEYCLAIPMKADMDSLNAVAATSIALYAYRTQWAL